MNNNSKPQVQRKPVRINENKNIKAFIVKPQKDKEKILKEAKRKMHLTYRRITMNHKARCFRNHIREKIV